MDQFIKKKEEIKTNIKKRECYGECLDHKRNSHGEWYIRSKICGENCQLITCPGCHIKQPEWISDAHRGKCVNCNILGWDQKSYKLIMEKKGCQLCGKRLLPIGNNRINGKDHNDWNGRIFHKKCWKEIMTGDYDEGRKEDMTQKLMMHDTIRIINKDEEGKYPYEDETEDSNQ